MTSAVGDVGMGAHAEGHPAIDDMTDRHLLRCCLGVVVEKDRVGRGAQAVLAQDGFQASEGIGQVFHEKLAHHIDDQKLAPVGQGKETETPTRCPGGVVGRAQQPRLFADEGLGFALIPAVVPAGDNIDTDGKKLVADLARDAESAGRVLAVDHDHVHPQIPTQPRQPGFQGVAASPADDISEEEDPHVRMRFGR